METLFHRAHISWVFVWKRDLHLDSEWLADLFISIWWWISEYEWQKDKIRVSLIPYLLEPQGQLPLKAALTSLECWKSLLSNTVKTALVWVLGCLSLPSLRVKVFESSRHCNFSLSFAGVQSLVPQRLLIKYEPLLWSWLFPPQGHPHW